MKTNKNYILIQPEVVSGLGEKTEFNTEEPVEGQKRFVTKLHIHLEDWLGDDLVETYPCYMVTEKLKNALEKSKFLGFMFHEIELTLDEYFDDNYQLSKDLPEFFWLKIIGEKGKDDLFISEEGLWISQKLVDFLIKKFDFKIARINPEKDEFDDLLNDMIDESKKNKKK